jgi:hypothetical protein
LVPCIQPRHGRLRTTPFGGLKFANLLAIKKEAGTMHVRLLVFALVSALVIPQLVMAQTPAVSPSELRGALATAAETRQKNLDQVRSFFATEPARAALKAGQVDYQKVEKAVAILSPEELAKLAAKTRGLERDFAAGALTNQELTYIVIALATAIIVLLIVAH